MPFCWVYNNYFGVIIQEWPLFCCLHTITNIYVGNRLKENNHTKLLTSISHTWFWSLRHNWTSSSSWFSLLVGFSKAKDKHICFRQAFIWLLNWLKKWQSEVTYSQVWWPILGISALHLSHPKCTHTAVNTHTPWTHTQSSGQPFMLRRPGSSWGFGALLKGTSVVVLKEERALDIHSPHLQFLPARDSNSQPLDYKSDSLTIRPQLPLRKKIKIK